MSKNPFTREIIGATVSAICDYLLLRVKEIEKTKNATNDPAVLNQLHGRSDEINEIATFLNMLLDVSDKVCNTETIRKKKDKPKIDIPVGDQSA